MTEQQADKIIKLLESIDGKLSTTYSFETADVDSDGFPPDKIEGVTSIAQYVDSIHSHLSISTDIIRFDDDEEEEETRQGDPQV